MITVKAAEFKAKCLKLMDKVQSEREEIIITKHGKPAAKLVAVTADAERPAYGFMKGTAVLNDDPIELSQETWEADGDG